MTPLPSPELLSLYRYFAYADHMAKLYAREMNEGWLQMLAEANEEDFSAVTGLFFSAPGIHLLYMYSGIYLVIEGWRELGLTDPTIDRLSNLHSLIGCADSATPRFTSKKTSLAGNTYIFSVPKKSERRSG